MLLIFSASAYALHAESNVTALFNVVYCLRASSTFSTFQNNDVLTSVRQAQRTKRNANIKLLTFGVALEVDLV